MKKIWTIMLVFVLAIIVTACEKKSEEFTKPENYSSVLIVTINPEFKLYLDKAGTVLAVEPVNDDAKSISKDIEFENKNYEEVVEKIVTTANEKGFVKKDATINLVIAESKEDKESVDEILNKATTTVNNTTTKLNVEVTVKQENNLNVENNTQNDNKTNEESKEEETHTHTFSEATCTKAATCECGETEGKALGHNYKDGKCTRCGAKDPNFSYTEVSKKNGKWTFEFAANDQYYGVTLKLSNEKEISYRMGMSYDLAYADDLELKEQLIAQCGEMSECKKYKNVYYWVAAGGGDKISVTENKNTVTLTDSEGNQLVLTRTGEKKLKVKTSPSIFGGLEKIPVGAVITFS